MSNEFKIKKGLIVKGEGGTVVDVQGESGQLFSVTDSLTGVLLSVNDITGIPILEVSSDDTVKMGPYSNPFIVNAIGLLVGTNLVVDSNGNIKFDGTPTTTNQNRGIYWTAYDKEGTTDPTDAAYIRHTINSGGLAGSVLEISSQNDADDGVNFLVNSNASGVRINGNAVLNAANFNSYSPTLTGGGASGTWGINITGNAVTSNRVLKASESNLNTAFTNTPAGQLSWTEEFNQTNAPTPSTYYNTISMRHGNPNNVYGNQLAIRWVDAEPHTYVRVVNDGNFGTWRAVLTDFNYNSYSPTLTGGGASGTWGINITGSAGSVDFNNLSNKTGGSGTYQTSGDFRAPIFYDSNDTAFYVDPNAASKIRNLYVGDSGSSWSDPGGWGTVLWVSNVPHAIIRVENRTENRQAVMWSHVGQTPAVGSGGDYDFRIARNFLDRLTIESTRIYSHVYLEAAGSLRAPIFYDSDNTAFYVDPASTSNLNDLRIQGDIKMEGSDSYIWMPNNNSLSTGFYDPVSGLVPIKLDGPSDGIFIGNNMWLSYNTANNNNYNENIRLFPAANGVSVIGFRAGANTSGGQPDTSILGFSDRFEIRYGDTWEERIYAGYAEARGSYRAPIFYDSNNTAFYVDPASTSNLQGLTVANTITGNISGNAATTSQTTFSRVRTDGINRGIYGSISISGSLNSYSGIDFTDASTTLMVRTSDGLSGMYRNNNTWIWYFDGSGSLTVGTVPWNSVSGKPNVVTGTGTSGQVSFWDGTTTQAGNNGFWWDNANGRVGINTTSPQARLHVNGAVRIDSTTSGPESKDIGSLDALLSNRGNTTVLGEPDTWLNININGINYAIPAYVPFGVS